VHAETRRTMRCTEGAEALLWQWSIHPRDSVIAVVRRREFSTMAHWPFDQAVNVAAITTRQVIEDGLPILCVVHYLEDDSWAFVCGTANGTEDGRVIRMDTALRIDPTLATIPHLRRGWFAQRAAVGSPWIEQLNTDDQDTKKA
jgi:hypothetical protein